MKATRTDVAREAGVSEQTVSYVLNKSRKFSPDIVERVQNAVEKLAYVPDRIALDMVKKQSKNVCIFVNDLTNPFFSDVIKGFQQEASANGYTVQLMDAFMGRKEQIINLLACRIAGIFITILPDEMYRFTIEELINNGVSVVLGNRPKLPAAYAEKVSYCEVDLIGGMKLLVEHLHTLGHDSIAYLSGLDIHTDYDGRYKSFVESCEALHIRYSVIENDAPSTDTASGERLAERFFACGGDASAVVVTNDLMAYGVLKKCREKGVHVPDRLTVVGFDDAKYDDIVYPTLTSVGCDKAEYGRQIFRSMQYSIENAHSAKPSLQPCYIVQRESSSQKSR